MNRFWQLLRSTTILLVGVALGTLTGWLVFSVSTLSGKQLFIAGGGLIGLVISALFVAYAKRTEVLSLSEVTIAVPEFAELKFSVNAEYRRIAWKLFIETLTRVSTQPLDSDSGSLREALNSLYKLFTDTRELLKEIQPSKPTTGVTVEMFAVKMLNQEIRPFLSKWHVRLKGFEAVHPEAQERDWDQNEDCRGELEALRTRLLSYTKAFGELAGIPNSAQFINIESAKD
jgi:hypothetical protein